MNDGFATAKIAGNPDEYGCSQAYYLGSEDPEKKKSHGELLLTVSIKDISDSTHSIFIIRGIAAQIQKKFYEEKDINIIDTLNEAVLSTIETYQKEIEVSALVIKNSVAYIVTYGTAEVLLARQGKVVSFTSPNGAAIKATGKIKADDIVVLATGRFVGHIAKGVLNAALEKNTPDKMVEFLAPNIQSKENNSDICAFIVKVQGDLETVSQQNKLPIINNNSIDKDKITVPENNKLSQQSSEITQKKADGFLDKIKSKKFYIKEFQDEKANKRRRSFSIIGLVLILLLTGTIVYGLYKKSSTEREERVQEISESIEDNLLEADEIVAYSPERAQELIDRSREELKKLEDPDLQAESRVASLREKINNAEGSVLGLYSPEANDFLDLSLLSEGFVGEELVTYGEQIYVLDTNTNRLIQVNVTNKRSEVVAGSNEIEGVKEIAVWSDDVYVLKEDGIYDIENNNLLESGWSSSSSIASYAGNVYLLDRDNSEIIRYAIDQGSLTSRTSWLSEEVDADFSQIVSWDIDGAIWLSSNSGSVYKYTFGYQQNFTLGKAAPELNSGTIIYASNDNENIYLLDRNNQRILVYDKEGDYIEQYTQEVIKEATDLAVYESESKIILLTGSRLKYLDIK